MYELLSINGSVQYILSFYFASIENQDPTGWKLRLSPTWASLKPVIVGNCSILRVSFYPASLKKKTVIVAIFSTTFPAIDTA